MSNQSKVCRMARLSGGIVLLLTSFVACSDPSNDAEKVGTDADPVVRGTLDEDHPSVLGVISSYASGGQMHYSACSGAYVAPRLVLTAAHCIPPNRYFTRVFYGSDFKAAFDALPYFYERPTADSPWAIAESFKPHPEFNTTNYFADIAVVSLDRELPIPVTPVAKWRLEKKQIGKLFTVVGFGATSSDQMLTQTEGWGLKRVGQAPYLGSPLATTETDHPGIGIAAVRDSLAMFDGHAPYANACAGDSGGPILTNHGGRPYVFGVSSWTGFYCENYSFYTRIHPFAAFIESAAERAGRIPVKPTIACARELDSGLTRVYFGYDNGNDVSLDVPLGDANRMPGDTTGMRPTHFYPGTHAYATIADYPSIKDVYWKLQSGCGPSQVVSKHTPRPACASDDFSVIAADACLAMAAAHCGQAFSDCHDDLLFQYDPTEPLYCPDEFKEWTACQATLPPDQFECSGDYAFDVSEACMDKQRAYFICAYGPI